MEIDNAYIEGVSNIHFPLPCYLRFPLPNGVNGCWRSFEVLSGELFYYRLCYQSIPGSMKSVCNT